ncbi:mycofactocin dehydrogenase MftG [Mycolicibacterium goodii]|uniref:Mycofactocin system GMC family oxidoreductase MftG n=1 Tax=Mycolicibacterium goodii TaxID=134601 RepID=A0ABS6HVI9_MYCGD|nr:mycofactocin system GMC family oxidoreductase MftG [Mycolicibacterium goodii]MBU8815803.1 mycofactocin system GMC family oxidoreductase MftG [Mycolicibacterium goodii]MBU8825530.1 mycofactocin system GMC family oxidoreductase MftG [Mycolicibacterium goodii]MBU8838676.1 mycofactocin system GMC family oxidoreductase MftG [Mycolicibacterium goodii]OKH64248.1 glucose-methanol-choline oxidoreductase [Mycobacterium sp. SWH-M5]
MSDVLIVGAGSAGSVLAERLSADPACRVTVVEAGPAPSDPRVAAQITDGLRLPIGAASSVVRHFPSTLTEHPPRHTEIIRGSVVGGSGAVNGGYFCRGLPTDFATWGVAGWSWDDVLPHFRAIETDLDFGTALHGSDGPIKIRRVREFDGCTAAFVDAAVTAGYGWIDDLNGSDAGAALPPGVGAVPLNIDGGTRLGPGGAYLQPALDRPNLDLRADTRVRRVLIERGAAIGVECNDGEILHADRIVLSAGAIGSAHLLLLSGVGPADELTALGIGVAAALPVGTATVDHPEWVLPVAWTATHDLPPLEAVLATADGVEIRPYTAGFSAMVHGPGHDPAELPHLGVALMRPHSRGRVRLASADPTVLPIIEHRYDTVAEDVEALRAAARMARELVSHTVEVGDPSWSTSQHLAGTAPMGVDDAAVLDPTCRVHGVDRLWVVDGSIMPAITSRGPHATIAMIGHRAAEFVVS